MHEQFLLAALTQAWLGRGSCAPNPAVGAVAVHNNTIIAQAFHAGVGLAHAEQALLNMLPENVADVTVYVTLEPCNHWGKTPPCVDALIARGIRHVVYGYRDPNPVVASNNTPARLAAHNVTVLHYPIPAIDAFYQSYTHWVRTGMPWVTVKMAQTLDGKIAGVNGERVLLSNQACFEFTHRNRLHSDVLLTTSATVLHDHPQLNVRQSDCVVAKPIAILDRTLKLSTNESIFHAAKHCHVYHDMKKPHHVSNEKCTFHPVRGYEQQLNLHDVLQDLGRLGCHDVWVEAGGTLFNALHRAHLVQRTYLYCVPRVLGTNATSLYDDNNVFQQARNIQWHMMDDNVMAIVDW
jgi:diaminohydroxyphosphoribosylaminopyrimidine deaminase/5-amino-6-(5-phosphoribosylamino)uracil reductase